jgi:proteasome lid subunit RPN8/RPN11
MQNQPRQSPETPMLYAEQQQEQQQQQVGSNSVLDDGHDMMLSSPPPPMQAHNNLTQNAHCFGHREDLLGTLAVAVDDAAFVHDAEAHAESCAAMRASVDARYVSAVRVSALALAKMAAHARSGGNIEVMGLMVGALSGRHIIVRDAFALPVEGTETRVNAAGEAAEYMVAYMDARAASGRLDDVVGWYHSHPGYGCWLSGIDVATQRLNQSHQDPFVAIVVDPHRTMSSGTVDIGAFRVLTTLPQTGNKSNNNSKNNINESSSSSNDNANLGTNHNDDLGPNNSKNANSSESFEKTPSKKAKTSSSVPSNAKNSQSQQQKQTIVSPHPKISISADIPSSKINDFGAHALEYYLLEVTVFRSSADDALLRTMKNSDWIATLAPQLSPPSEIFKATESSSANSTSSNHEMMAQMKLSKATDVIEKCAYVLGEIERVETQDHSKGI